MKVKLLSISLLVTSIFLFITPTKSLAATNGWQLQQTETPNDPGFLSGQLIDTTAISNTDVWTVGTEYDSSTTTLKTLAEHYNGQEWSVVPSVDVASNPSPGNNESLNVLTSVTALSSNDVWAAGDSQETQGEQVNTLVEHWDGTQWNVISTPNPGLYNLISGISADSSTDIWAVGSYLINILGTKPLIEHWDGTNWTVVDQPLDYSASATFNAVTAISPNDVWAVGHYQADTNTTLPIIEHWDGTSWSVVPSPAIGNGLNENSLSHVAAISSNNVWTVGSYTDSDNTVKPLVEHWDGNTWSIIPTPDTPSNSGGLSSLFPLAANDIWAVGATGVPGTKSDIALIEHWDGNTWSIVPSPVGPQFSGRTFDDLLAITGTTNNLWATGEDANGALIETNSLLDTNQPPIIGTISTSPNPIKINTSASLSASFTDPNTSDTHTVVWNWGDGSATQSGTVTESNGSGSVTDSHTYTALGSYTVTLTVRDNGGLSTTSSSVVAVTPAGGLHGGNLSGKNYSGSDLSGQNISGSNLSNGMFNNVNFSNANLSGSNGSQGSYTSSNFTSTNLSGGNFSRANFTGSNLTNANLSGANVSNANWTNSNFTGANLRGTNFHGAIITGVTWSNTVCPDGTNSNNDNNTCVGHGGGL